MQRYIDSNKDHRKMYCANANEKKAGVGESDTTEQLRMSTATTKSKRKWKL